jgi:hypothetical protein
MNYIKIAKEIQYDIDRGVYNDFPVLRRQLERVMQKLYVTNCELTKHDLDLLQFNEYLED